MDCCKVLSRRVATTCWLLLSLVPAATAQQVEQRGGTVETAPSRQAILDGVQLEKQHRWRDAVVHYEQALKALPDDPQIQQRLTLVRTHMDIDRRYADGSFTQSLRGLGERQALDLYSEVLVKIQTHYVEEPDWARLVDYGAYHLQVALMDETFMRFNSAAALVDRDALIARSRELRAQLQSTPILDRRAARDAVWTAARLGRERLGLTPTTVILEFICGATSALDRYSSFLTAAELRDVYSQIEGNFVGLGVELKAEKQSLLIVDVIPGGPAADAGVQRGDRIVEVDHAPLTEVSPEKAADMLRGPAGSQVEVMLVTSLGSARRLQLTRRQVEVPSVVDVKIIEPSQGIGYLRVTSFQKTTNRDIDSAMWRLQGQGMQSLIIDLRGNPGGLLNSAVEIADKFIDQGPLLSTRGRSAREDFDYHARVQGTWRVPLVVLIDHDSASASEIFAGAIRDHRRGLVVGQRSYGKGSVQGIFELNLAEVGIRLTTAKFYSPSGQAISNQGVTPDIAVEPHAAARVDGGEAVLPDEAVLAAQRGDAQRDAVLQAAVQAARRQLSQR